jgi:L-prolyl-PCP dehydrogenase
MDFGWSPEQSALHRRMREVGAEAQRADPADRLAILVRHGVLGLALSTNHGGGGHTLLDSAYAMEGLGASLDDAGLLLVAGAHLFGVAVCIERIGSDDQKATWLPRLSRGELVATVAATEHEAGSDVAAVVTEVADDPTTVSGDKAWVTHAANAGLFLVLGRAASRRGLSVALVPSGPRVQVGEPLETVGLRSAGLCPVRFDAAPGDRLGKAGAGMAVFQTAMVLERALVLAFRLGAMERSLDEATGFVRHRSVGGKPIAQHQAVSHRLAKMKLRLETARLLLYRAAWTLDQGGRGHLEAALAKWHVAEAAVENAFDAMRLRGGAGYLERAGLGDTLDDALGGSLHSGTNDVLAGIVAGWLGV